MFHIAAGTGAFPLIFPPDYQDITDEALAADFLEKMRWGNDVTCSHCGSKAAKKIMAGKNGERNKHLYWRCQICRGRFNVRSGTMMEYTHVPLCQWLRVLYLLSSQPEIRSLEIQRRCQFNRTTCSYILRRIHAGAFRTGKAWLTGAITISRS